MNYKIEEIEGIGPTYGKKLAAAGVKTTNELLKRGGKPAGRKELETATGISHAQILKWCNLADLMRVKGIGKQFSAARGRRRRHDQRAQEPQRGEPGREDEGSQRREEALPRGAFREIGDGLGGAGQADQAGD